MIPVASPLRILDFAATGFEFSIVPGVDEETIGQKFDKYELDIDFDMFKTDILQVRIRAYVNQIDKPLPGYSLYAEAACIFEFAKDKKLTKEEKNNIEGYSTIYIALNSLRGLISNFTANAPFGRYILPSIDLNDLIKKKIEQDALKEFKSKKEKIKSK